MARVRIMGNQSEMETCSSQAVSGEATNHHPTNGTEKASTSTRTTERTPCRNKTTAFAKKVNGATYADVIKHISQEDDKEEEEELPHGEVRIEPCDDDRFSFFDTSNEEEFPLLLPIQPLSDDTSLSSLLGDEEDPSLRNGWKDTDDDILLTKSERIYHLYRNAVRDNIFDVTFSNGEAGKGRYEVYAHSFILSMHCLRIAFTHSEGVILTPPIEIKFPNLTQYGLSGMLEYIYSGKFDVEEMGEGEVGIVNVSLVLAAAKECGCPDLIQMCSSFLQKQLTVETAAVVFNIAHTEGDEQLKALAFSFIANKPNQVFSSQDFLKLTEDALCELLHNDEWYMNEVDVFHAVRRWAENNMENAAPTGEQLRQAMGQAFYAIRFGVMEKDDIFGENGIDVKYDELFSTKEKFDMLLRLTIQRNQPIAFICRERKSLIEQNTCPSSTTEEADTAQQQSSDAVSTSIPTANPGLGEDVGRQAEPVAEPPASVADLSNCSRTRSFREFGELLVQKRQPSHESPNKKRKKRISDPVMTTTPSEEMEIHNQRTHEMPPTNKKRKKRILDPMMTPTPKRRRRVSFTSITPTAYGYDHSMTAEDKPLNKLIQQLIQDQEKDTLENIYETVELTLIPNLRVHLCNLKNLHLKLKLRKPFSCGTAFKSQMKTKSQSLKHLIFFDKQSAQTETDSVIINLLSQRVNIILQCVEPDSTLLKIDHEKGILVMNLLKDAQLIIDGAHNFPLKELCVSECELTSLAPVRQDLLEVIVMRRVKGLTNPAGFLNACPALKQIAWNEMVNEEINLKDLLTNAPHLMKLSLAKCNLVLSEIVNNNLQEFYVDNCTWAPDFIDKFPTLFPFLKRIVIYGSNCHANYLLSILQMPRIEYIFLWKMEFTSYIVNRKKIRDENSQKATEFLACKFGKKYVNNNQVLTFILERSIDEGPSTSSSALQTHQDPFDASKWRGERLSGEYKLETISRVDFQHSSYDYFYIDYDAYFFSEASENDVKRMKNKQLKSTNTNANPDVNNGEYSPGMVEVGGINEY